MKRAVETNSKVKVCGASHSPNDIARTTDILVNLDKFNKILFLDKEKKTVKVIFVVSIKILKRISISG